MAPQDFMDQAFTGLDRAMCLADASGAASYALDTVLGLSEAENGTGSSTAGRGRSSRPCFRHHRAVPSVHNLRDLLRLPSEAEGS